MAFLDTQVRPQGEQVDAIASSKMKLSAAIRIGAKIRPQTTGGNYFFDGSSCAIGAAFEALGLHQYVGGQITSQYGAWQTLTLRLNLPRHLHPIITNRNDRGESRESIADWLESQGL